MNESNYNLTAVGTLLQRRAKKTKLFLLSCVPSGKRHNKVPTSTTSISDGETQTTPSIEKTFCRTASTGTEENCLQMPTVSCAVDSSRNSLYSDSDTYMESCDSHDNQSEGVGDTMLSSKLGNCPCLERFQNAEFCKWRLHENMLLEKLTYLQQEVNSISLKLHSLKSGEATAWDQCVSFQVLAPPAAPPVPPPPPPFPPSPIFQHSVSLQSLPQRQSTSKIQCDEMASTQDRGKPIVTLEDLQKVKLRQVSSVANVKC